MSGEQRKRTELDVLVERLARAAEPDRDIDYDLALSCDWKVNGGMTFRQYAMEYPKWVRRSDEWPRYTRSIDAALTLMPERTAWSVQATKATFQADCRMRGETVTAQASTAAIALCIAALRARAALARTAKDA